ncbi:hypothetical protein Q4494_15120 [Celeribacter halophilus]|uniref:Secreted protein n=1 Tax=Celeribacter halophilus TaxID=576117 RepID=A0AAW7XWM5_9RHOB|nr:hypothetical protein [Celeribacter halophilus]MDO6458420.1 hypothetical protein [Celeribacter halophilus]
MLKLLVVPQLVRQAVLLPLPLRLPPLQVVRAQQVERALQVQPQQVVPSQVVQPQRLVWPCRELGQLAYRLLASVSAWRVSLGL